MTKKKFKTKDLSKLISHEYPCETLQELIAELVLKTEHLNDVDPNVRFTKIMDALLGKPEKQKTISTRKEAAKFRKAYGIIKYTRAPYNFTPFKACDAYIKCKYIPDHKPGTRPPRDLSDEIKQKIKREKGSLYNGVVKGNFKEIEEQFLAEQYTEYHDLEDQVLEIIQVKEWISSWLERYQKY